MDDAPKFHIEGAIPFLLLLDGETKTLEILAAAMVLSFWNNVPKITIYSVDNFFSGKRKGVYISYIFSNRNVFENGCIQHISYIFSNRNVFENGCIQYICIYTID